MKYLYLLVAAYSIFTLSNSKIALGQAKIDIKSYFQPEILSLADVDTTVVVYNAEGKVLAYNQYEPLIMSGKFFIFPEKGKRYLKPRPGIPRFFAENDSIGNLESMFSSNSASLKNSLYHWLRKADRIRVEKSKRKLYIERNGKILYEFPINLGNHPVGHKQKEGDGRTPEGSYFIDYNINSKAAYKLGFHISYPNPQDSLNAKKMGVKPGGDVMIHGTSQNRSKFKRLDKWLYCRIE
jgi:hypothetical protein